MNDFSPQNLLNQFGAIPQFIGQKLGLLPSDHNNVLTQQAVSNLSRTPTGMKDAPGSPGKYVQDYSPNPQYKKGEMPYKVAQPVTSSDTSVPSAVQAKINNLQQPTPQVEGASTSKDSTFGRNPGTNPKSISPVVQNAINSAADYYKVPRSLMYDMASAESTFNPNNINNTPDGVKAGYPTGLYQFTTQPGFDNEGKPMTPLWDTLLSYGNTPGSTLHLPNGGKNPSDPVDNAYGAAYLISHGQLGRWDASDGNWGKFYSPQELEKQGFYSQDTTHTPGKFYYQLAKK